MDGEPPVAMVETKCVVDLAQVTDPAVRADAGEAPGHEDVVEDPPLDTRDRCTTADVVRHDDLASFYEM